MARTVRLKPALVMLKLSTYLLTPVAYLTKKITESPQNPAVEDKEKSMKAVVHDHYGGPEMLRLSDIDVPEPTKGQIRVKVLACSVNLSDWEHLTGSPLWVRAVAGAFRPNVKVLGSDIVGLVDKLGEGVSGFNIGQRVMGDYVMSLGGFAEYACVPAQETVEVPDALSDEIAACLPQSGGIAVSGTADLSQGDRFLINGAGGGSGTLALQLARAAGAHVTAVDNAKKSEWLATLGADDVIDYTRVDFTKTGAKWDRILDMVATRGARDLSRALVVFASNLDRNGKTFHAKLFESCLVHFERLEAVTYVYTLDLVGAVNFHRLADRLGGPHGGDHASVI